MKEFTMEKELNRLYGATFDRSGSDIESLMEVCDLSDIANELSEYEDRSNPEFKVWLEKFIQSMNFIDENTEIATPVDDDTYDRLLELYKSLGGIHFLGPSYQEVASEEDHTGYHKYPEIRGTLGKVHFIHRRDIPENDSRKSLEDYYNNVCRQFSAVGKDVPKSVVVVCALKYDGTSQVFECEKDEIKRVLTRYKVELNLGKDVTHVYKGSGFKLDIPDYFKNLSEYGVKTECYMNQNDFDQYVKDYGDSKCNRRSAITSIVNRSEERMDHELLKYVSVRPFQISSKEFIKIPEWDETTNPWYYCGEIGGHHQWIWTGGYVSTCSNFYEPEEFLNIVDNHIPVIQEYASEHAIPIDGVVVTLLNDGIISLLGRKSDVNQFQIAYKIPAGIEKTKLKSVEFQVGTTTGAITPVAIVEPVVINGSTITNAGLSNFDKLERLNLHIGDEVLIKYDIVPKLMKDDTCIENTKSTQIIRIDHCPICNGALEGNRCINRECPSKVPGKILNYIRKIGIKGIGRQMVNDLVREGIVTSIPDLYKLEEHRDKIIGLPGYGVITYENMVKSVYGRLTVYPHEIIGSVGIPDIATRTAMLICKKYRLDELLSDVEGLRGNLTNIPGIGEKKADKITQGIVDNYETILYLTRHMEIKEYEEEKRYSQTVAFTNVRDKDFEEFLNRNGVEVSDSWVSRVSMLIVPDGVPVPNSTKVTKATKAGVPIITLAEAKEKFRYKG